MKKKIPGVIVLLLGCVTAGINPTAGGALVIIGVIMLVVMKDKKKAKQTETPSFSSGPTEYPVGVVIRSQKDLAAIRTKNPNYENPRNNGKPVYEYRFFDEECKLVPDKKTINVMYGDVLVGYVDAIQAESVIEIMDSIVGEPRLRIFGGGVKEWDGTEWIVSSKPPRAEVRIVCVR